MALSRPYRRTCRQLADGSYGNGGHWQYLLHRRFARDPQHYVRAFLLLQKDLQDLFAYVEPSTSNLGTYSHRIQQLLMRACVEVEANFTAILFENSYNKNSVDLNMGDYKLVNHSHFLSSYEVRIPGWHGSHEIRRPFSAWDSGSTLQWYRAYNKSKHDRHGSFHLATFDALIDAMCGLVALLSAQFHDEDYSPSSKSISIGPGYSYDTDDGMESAIGGYFRVKIPMDLPGEERYGFDWGDLREEEDPFVNFNHAAYAQQ